MSDATTLYAARGGVLLGPDLACSGLGRWVAGRLGGRALLGFVALYLGGLALGTAFYAALWGLPEDLGDAAKWRRIAGALLGE